MSRLSSDGRIVWQADTGFDRLRLSQIIPGPDRTAFVGVRPPVPDQVSEPLMVIVEHASGKVVTHSLWR